MGSVEEKSGKKDGSDLLLLPPTASEEQRNNSISSSRSSSEGSSDEVKVKATEDCASPSPLGWPIRNAQVSKSSVASGEAEGGIKVCSDDTKLKKLDSKDSELEMMKERFAKLLLGEDMSGSGKGVCTAMAISNAITNLCATIFGQVWRLEPLPSEKKLMWRREIECLLCVSDHIVELMPSWQTFSDGSKLEVMTCRPRSDLFINLPALRKLDNMLLEILDSFSKKEFWYVDQGVVAPEGDRSSSFCKPLQREEEKWWLPVPRVPAGGLQENTRKQLNHKRECASQIMKAAMVINNCALAEMEVPESYLENLPKNGRSCLGDVIYRYITSEQFSSECLLECLDLSSEHIALEIANRVEASIYVWRRRLNPKPVANPNRSASKSSWGIVKDLVLDGDKREILAERAEGLLLCLKQRFPGLTQTTLDTSKIQCNKDVGKSILESYSRVLESLAFNIVARIDDLLYVDELTRQSEKLSSVSVVAHKKITIPYPVPVSGTPNKAAFAIPTTSPAPLISPAMVDRTPFPNGNNNKAPRRGLSVKRVLSNYLGSETKVKSSGNLLDRSISKKKADLAPASGTSRESNECQGDPSAHQNMSRLRPIDS